ncbi:hypothetical protein GGR50DRAFT_371125 [Xylaria sp. CBS 124048]|nr:hypothetical protein GGR50DRAFT_371125 [Xylaria sp. CBS 124048]
MTSFVTDLLVNPVLRQARRFSFTRSSVASKPAEPDSPPPGDHAHRHPQKDVVIFEAEENSSVQNDPGNNTLSRLPSGNSVLMNPYIDIENHRLADDIAIPTDDVASTVNAQVPGSPSDSASTIHRNMSTFEQSSPSFMESANREHHPLPEDDGMSSLRKRIFAIQAQEIDHSEKAHLMHELLMEGYTKSRAHFEPEQLIPPSSPRVSEKRVSQGHGPLEVFKFWQNALDEAEIKENSALTDKDLEPTFVPRKQSSEPNVDAADSESDGEQFLGCEHYRRNVKLQCSTCNRWYSCRFCHDKVEDHNLIRKETRYMLCMLCGTAQKASQTCVSCEVQAASYYCDICKLWNDDPDKPCYHCSDCGICRIGHGIGKDFYHCKKCCACISIASQSDHRCIERVIDCDCPICGDYMFTSPKSVCFMKCGHSIHRDCLEEHQKNSYKCPICNKSLLNMESQFRNLELSIQAQPMPVEFRDTRALVLCHDCSAKTSTSYHWLGLKCGICASYNTAQLQIIGADAVAIEANRVGRGNALALGPVGTGNDHAIMMEASMRDMRRRHSSVTGPAFIDAQLNTVLPDRLARSVSPIPTPGRPLRTSAVGGYFDLGGEDDEGDIFSFWRTGNGKAENDDDDCAESSDDDDDLTADEEMDDEDEGEYSEDDDFELLGHR